jgi:anti-sigma28 factor (negative regulator of flagellin synthesis)
MSNIRLQTSGNTIEVAEELQEQTSSRRVRQPTLLKLQWLAERVRKCERIKRQIAEGTYCVESEAIAKALLNTD